MSAENEFGCKSCGSLNLGGFVQQGSYFSRCTACGESGWATSWIAVSGKFSSSLRAVVVDEQFNEIEVLGEGTGQEIIEKISQAAYQGKLVQLFATKNDA